MGTIKVKGMMCMHCVAAVQEAMEAVAEAGEVKVDLAAGKAEWTGTATAQSMADAVKEQGYEAESV